MRTLFYYLLRKYKGKYYIRVREYNPGHWFKCTKFRSKWILFDPNIVSFANANIADQFKKKGE